MGGNWTIRTTRSGGTEWRVLRIESLDLLPVRQFDGAWLRQQTAQSRIEFSRPIECGEKGLPLRGRKRKFLLFGQFNLSNGASTLHNELSHGLSLAEGTLAQKRLFGVG